MHAARPSVNAISRTLKVKIKIKNKKNKYGNNNTKSNVGRRRQSFIEPRCLSQLLGQMINDLGASVNGSLVVLGDKLGIYTALADIADR
jgi:hypothetical protein